MSIHFMFIKPSNYLSCTNYHIVNLLFLQLKKTVIQYQTNLKSTNVDAIDSFTNELIERKTLKWEIMRQLKQKQVPTPNKKELLLKSTLYRPTELLKEISNYHENPLCIELGTLNQHQIDNLCLNAMYSKNKKDLNMLVDQCILLKKGPTNKVFIELIDYFANLGNTLYLEKMIDLCMDINTSLYSENNKFTHYVAKCYWVNGNSILAIKLLKEMYTECDGSEIKRTVRKILKELVRETIGKKSEAVLIGLKNSAETLCNKHNDYFLLTSLWINCFQSQWYSDQQLAAELFSNYQQLRNLISNKISRICFGLLKEHNVEGVYRLIELLLKFDMKSECKTVLSLLFDYQYWRNNLRACTEILQSCLELNMELSDVQSKKLLKLLLAGKSSPSSSKTKTNVAVFELKF